MTAVRFDLSEEELAFFHENGFLRPFRVYEPEEVDHLWQTVRGQLIHREFASYANDFNYDRHLDVSLLSRHIMRPEIVDRVKSLLGEDVLCWRTEFFSKLPGEAGTEWHQIFNFSYGMKTPCLVPEASSGPDDLLELSVWLALTDATREGGCLKLMPGSHKNRYFDEMKPFSGEGDVVGGKKTAFFGYHYSDLRVDPSWEPEEGKAAVLEMQRGEAVIFLERTLHGSMPNATRRPRVAFTTRYSPSHVRVYPGMQSFSEHGQTFPLDKYGVVLVSGTDAYGHNELVDTNNRGEPFRRTEEARAGRADRVGRGHRAARGVRGHGR